MSGTDNSDRQAEIAALLEPYVSAIPDPLENEGESPEPAATPRAS